MLTIEDLKTEYYNHNLTEFLKTLTDEQINEFLGQIYRNDIVGDLVNILDALLNEVEYRRPENAKSSCRR